MKKFLPFLILSLCFTAWEAYAQSNSWVTAYYAGWNQGQADNGVLPSSDIDFSTLTHIIHFGLVPNTNGTLDSTSNTLTVINSDSLIAKAHAAGKKVLICVGGWGSESAFEKATSVLTLPAFIANLVSFMQRRGYDGIDVDWEPLSVADVAQYTLLITGLRTSLNLINPTALLTVAVASEAATIASLIDQIDQINVMTYDMSGAYTGWVTWYNAPLFNGGAVFPSNGDPLPSASSLISTFLAAGIPANKIGIGIPFYGYVWSGGSGTPTGGVTRPQQSWTTAPNVQSDVPYATIMQEYYQPQYLRWDSVAQVPYLSIDKPGSSNDKFISFDDERAVWYKMKFARDNGLGGVFIWELGGGYRNDLPSGRRDSLLQSVKQAYEGNGPPAWPADTIPPSVSITRPSEGETLIDTTTIVASAADNAGILNVQFQMDGKNFGQPVETSPYTLTIDTDTIPNGAHTISAIAEDVSGNTTSATTVHITVSNSPPATPILLSPKNGATDVPTPVTLQWSDSTQGISYRVQISDSSDFNTTVVNLSNSADTFYVAENLAAGKTFFWHVASILDVDTGSFSETWSFSTPQASGVNNPGTGLPLNFVLFQNYPNPFNNSTRIIFGLPTSAQALLIINDISGQTIYKENMGIMEAGYHAIEWSGTNQAGNAVSSGVYFFHLIATDSYKNKFSDTIKMVVIK
jgi:chitinase